MPVPLAQHIRTHSVRGVHAVRHAVVEHSADLCAAAAQTEGLLQSPSALMQGSKHPVLLSPAIWPHARASTGLQAASVCAPKRAMAACKLAQCSVRTVIAMQLFQTKIAQLMLTPLAKRARVTRARV